MKRYIINPSEVNPTPTDKFNGYTSNKPVTREVKPLIENERFNENDSDIELVANPDNYIEVADPYYNPEEYYLKEE